MEGSINLSVILAAIFMLIFLVPFYFAKPDGKIKHILGLFVIWTGWMFSDLLGVELVNLGNFLPMMYARSITDFDWKLFEAGILMLYNFTSLDVFRQFLILSVLVCAEVYLLYVAFLFSEKIAPVIVDFQTTVIKKIPLGQYASVTTLSITTKLFIFLFESSIWAYAHQVASLGIFLSLLIGSIFSSYVLVKTRNIYIILAVQLIWDVYILIL